jgi:hypothetical protein
MTSELTDYLETIRRQAKLEGNAEPEVMSELEAHIADTMDELEHAGLSEEEAVRTCLGQMGGATLIARKIYEAHSQGTWRHVLLASLPHLLFAVVFALNWWQHPSWMSIVLLLTLATAAYGWMHGRPHWAFSWFGYMLVPVVTAGVLLLYLPRLWSLISLVVYFSLTLWWLFRVVVQTTRRDWIFISLSLVQLPVIAGWFMAVVPDFKFTEETVDRVSLLAPWICLSFLLLAATIAAFIRIRQRWLRVGLLVTSGLGTLSLVGYYSAGGLRLTVFFGLILVMWGIFLLPPLADRIIRRDGRKSLWKDPRFMKSRRSSGA